MTDTTALLPNRRFVIRPLDDGRRVPACSVVDTLRGIVHGTLHRDGEQWAVNAEARIEAVLLNQGKNPVHMAKHPNNNRWVHVDPNTGQETMR